VHVLVIILLPVVVFLISLIWEGRYLPAYQIWHRTSNGYTSKRSGPYWSNPPS